VEIFGELAYYVRKIQDTPLKDEFEIDESLFGRRTKYHRGNRMQKITRVKKQGTAC